MEKKSQKITKIVFSGGPGVGKTTLLNALEKLGYQVRREVFTEIFRKQTEKTLLKISLKIRKSSLLI